MLQQLFSHLKSNHFTARYGWKPGTLGVWDNRCSQHYAVNDYHGHRREMWRVTIEAA